MITTIEQVKEAIKEDFNENLVFPIDTTPTDNPNKVLIQNEWDYEFVELPIEKDDLESLVKSIDSFADRMQNEEFDENE